MTSYVGDITFLFETGRVGYRGVSVSLLEAVEDGRRARMVWPCFANTSFGGWGGVWGVRGIEGLGIGAEPQNRCVTYASFTLPPIQPANKKRFVRGRSLVGESAHNARLLLRVCVCSRTLVLPLHVTPA